MFPSYVDAILFFIKWFVFFPILTSFLFIFIIQGFENYLLRNLLQPYVDVRLVKHDLNLIGCALTYACFAYYFIRKPLVEFLGLLPNNALPVPVDLIYACAIVGIVFALRGIAVLISETRARSVAYAFLVPQVAIGAFGITFYLFSEVKAPFFDLPQLQGIFLLSGIVVCFFPAECFLSFILSHPKLGYKFRNMEEIWHRIPTYPELVMGRQNLYHRLAEILEKSNQVVFGSAGTFAYYEQEDYPQEFKDALKRYRDALKGAKDRNVTLLYVGVVDNEPNWKFNDIIGRCEAGARIRHLDIEETRGWRSDIERKMYFTRFLCGDARHLSVEYPIDAMPKECHISYYFENAPDAAGLFTGHFQTLWACSTNVFIRADKLLHDKNISESQFIDLLKKYPESSDLGELYTSANCDLSRFVERFSKEIDGNAVSEVFYLSIPVSSLDSFSEVISKLKEMFGEKSVLIVTYEGHAYIVIINSQITTDRILLYKC